MPKLPILSGAEVVRVLLRHGYTQVRTKGSHVRLYPPASLEGAKKTTVPLHKEIRPGTLLNILKDALLTATDLEK
jgi:predicted RNA binding protein YcfA (HicA-like mRNA interferase family)